MSRIESYSFYLILMSAFILILISWNFLYSYSKEFEVLLIMFILNNRYDVVDVVRPSITNICTKLKVSLISVRTLKFSLEDCVFVLLAVFVFFFFYKCNNN